MRTPESVSSMSPFVATARRRRTHLACIACRDRKSRCDGARPACASCVRRKQAESCTYDQAAMPSNRYITALEDRVRKLESRNNRRRSPEPGRDASMASETAAVPSGPPPSATENTLGPEANRTPGEGQDPPSTVAGGSEPAPQVDTLATVLPTENDDNFNYGGSSTIAFLRQVTHASQHGADAAALLQDTHLSGPISCSTGKPYSSSLTLPRKLPPPDGGLTSLPLRYHADRYMSCYWEFVHPLFPLYYKPDFVAKYEQLWLPRPGQNADGVEDILFLCSLNLILALGCQFCDEVPPSERLAIASQFFERSQHFITYDIMGSTSLSLVQWLLSTAVYCQSSSQATRCWNAVGLAIRMAQYMGLHSEQPVQAKSPVEREIKRRVWHTCVVFDRLLAMTFGRQVVLNTVSHSTQIPLEIDDEYLRDVKVVSQPPDRPSRMGLFVWSCRLFEILEGILGTFYERQSDPKQMSLASLQHALSDVLGFNRRLDEFAISVPDHLNMWLNPRAAILSEELPYIQLQQQVLYCRFLYVRILCLRPMLLGALQTPDRNMTESSSIDLALVRWCSELCVDTAYQLVGNIDEHIGTPYKSPGWHSVYFIFASATIIITSRKLPFLSRKPEGALENAWASCMRVLNHYRDRVPAAPRAIAALESLRRQAGILDGQEPPIRHGAHHTGLLAIDGASTTAALQMSEGVEYSHLNFGPLSNDFTNTDCDTWFLQQLLGLDFAGGA